MISQRAKHILCCSLVYVTLSHIPLILTYYGFKLVFYNPDITNSIAYEKFLQANEMDNNDSSDLKIMLEHNGEKEFLSEKDVKVDPRVNLFTGLNENTYARNLSTNNSYQGIAGENVDAYARNSAGRNRGTLVRVKKEVENGLGYVYNLLQAGTELESNTEIKQGEEYPSAVTLSSEVTRKHTLINKLLTRTQSENKPPKNNLKNIVKNAIKNYTNAVFKGNEEYMNICLESGEGNLSKGCKLILQYIQPRSVLNYSASNLLMLKEIKFIPTLKNPCFFVNAVGKDEIRVAGNLTIKCLPYFFIFGVEKCGTSDLYYRLKAHQHVHVSIVKEPQFFNNNTQVGGVNHHHGLLGGYSAMFRNGTETIITGCPYQLQLENIAKFKFDSVRNYEICPHILLDATPRYFHNNFGIEKDPVNAFSLEPIVLTAHRIKSLLPNSKLIIMLRNPTDRVLSAYRYFGRLKNVTDLNADNFHQFVSTGIKIWNACINMRSEKNCAYNFRLKELRRQNWYEFGKFNQIRTGLYYLFMREYLPIFPSQNLEIFRMEDYGVNATNYLKNNVLNFIGLKNYDVFSEIGLNKYKNRVVNKMKVGPEKMLDETRKLLDNFYKPYNVRLANLLNDNGYLWRS